MICSCPAIDRHTGRIRIYFRTVTHLNVKYKYRSTFFSRRKITHLERENYVIEKERYKPMQKRRAQQEKKPKIDKH